MHQLGNSVSWPQQSGVGGATRCNVLVRRRCQHHGPLSWPGFLSQHFLSQLIGPDTNFLAEFQSGRCNLIADPRRRHRHTNTHLPATLFIIQPLIISTTAGCRLTSSLSIASDWLTNTLGPPLPRADKICCPVSSEYSLVKRAFEKLQL